MRRYLFVVTTRLGWSVYGQRLRSVALRDRSRHIDFALYTPWNWGRRVTRQTRYGASTSLHLPLFDPFTMARMQAAPYRQRAAAYDAVVAGTQGMAGAILGNRNDTPVFALIDATRNLYRQLGIDGISDRAIARETVMFRRFRHIFPYSNWVAEDLVATSGVARDHVTTLPPLAQEFGAARPPLGRERLQALFVGSDFVRKGGELLIKAQRERFWPYVDLTIVTPTAHHRNDIPNTCWLPPQTNDVVVEKLLPQSDVLLHPTTRDCSAIVVVEAAVAGVPAITTNVGGIPDLIEDGETGILVSPGDVGMFVEAVLKVASDRDLLRRMRTSCQRKGATEFVGSQVYERMMGIIDASL